MAAGRGTTPGDRALRRAARSDAHGNRRVDAADPGRPARGARNGAGEAGGVRRRDSVSRGWARGRWGSGDGVHELTPAWQPLVGDDCAELPALVLRTLPDDLHGNRERGARE